MDDTPPALVVVAHGSRAEGANDAHRDLCAALGERLDVEVHPAFLELASPSIPETLDAVARPGGRVVVHPHFLAPGNHTTRDIPALVEEARARHPEVTFELAGHTGADPAIVDALAASLAHRLG